MSNSVAPTYYADFSGLEGLKKDVKADDPKAIRAAAQQFESLFTTMMLKSMREAKLGDALGDNQQSDVYQDMYDQQIALKMSQGKGLGLADMLVQQLTRNRAAKAGAISSTSAGGSASGASNTVPAAAATSPVTGSSAPAVTAADRISFVKSLEPYAQQAASRLGVSADTLIAHAALETGWGQHVPSGGNGGSSFNLFGVKNLEPYAQQAASRLGVSADTVIAHAALETGWGQHVPSGGNGGSSFNLFGVKAGSSWSGDSVNSLTTEVAQGHERVLPQAFRSYGSTQQGIDDYVSLLSSPRYARALGTGADVGAFAQGLSSGGYATDPNYARKLEATAVSVKALRATTAVAPLKILAGLPTTTGVET